MPKIQVKVIQGPVAFGDEQYQDGETFEGETKAIEPLLKAAVVVKVESPQQPLSPSDSGAKAPQSPTEIKEEEATLPQELIEEKNETLQELPPKKTGKQ